MGYLERMDHEGPPTSSNPDDELILLRIQTKGDTEYAISMPKDLAIWHVQHPDAGLLCFNYIVTAKDPSSYYRLLSELSKALKNEFDEPGAGK